MVNGEMILLFLTGFFSGVISGMGIGGGTILIPALVLLVNPGQHVAQSVNLLFFIPTAVIALIVHIKKKRVNFKIAVPIILFGLAGAVAGSKLAMSMPGNNLKKWFGVFLLLMGAYELFLKKDDSRKTSQRKQQSALKRELETQGNKKLQGVKNK